MWEWIKLGMLIYAGYALASVAFCVAIAAIYFAIYVVYSIVRKKDI